jgi:hypothetical protein
MRTIYAPDMDWEGAFRDVATGDVSEAFSTWRATATPICSGNAWTA